MVEFRLGKYVDESAKLTRAVRKAGFDALRRLGFLVVQRARASIKREKGASAPGTPPHSHAAKAQSLPGSILYTTEDNPPRMIAGPAYTLAERLGGLDKADAFQRKLISKAPLARGFKKQEYVPLEIGGTYNGKDFPPRPFMGPALAAEVGELPGLLADKLAHMK
jgi:hypothetical protein